MERRLSSNSGTETTEREKKGAVYAVFEWVSPDRIDNYAIYKLDADVDDEVLLQQQPIEILRSPEYPIRMILFSVGSRIYFCGGFHVGDQPRNPIYAKTAYMFDATNSGQGVVPINSMESPKRFPFVFGPIDGYKFYIFTPSSLHYGIHSDPTFEMLDTNTNEWKSLPLPPSPSGNCFSSNTVCGSNILLYSTSFNKLFVFCTISENWRIVYPNTYEPTSLPFTRSTPLFCGNKIGHHIILASPRLHGAPVIYFSPKLPPVPVKNENGMSEIIYPVGDIEYVEKLEGLSASLKGIPVYPDFNQFMIDSFSSDYGSRVCIVRLEEPRGEGVPARRYFIDIYNLSLQEDEGKVKVENVVTYKYCDNSFMGPRHFHFVA